MVDLFVGSAIDLSVCVRSLVRNYDLPCGALLSAIASEMSVFGGAS